MCLYDDEGSIYNQGSEGGGGGGGGGSDIFVDGVNDYPTVQIGSLLWTTKSLHITDKSFIYSQPAHMNGVNDQKNFYFSNNNGSVKSPNMMDVCYYSVESMKYINASLLKDGWRVPVSADFDNLFNSVPNIESLISSDVDSGWYSPGTNSSGFDLWRDGIISTGGGWSGDSGATSQFTSLWVDIDSAIRELRVEYNSGVFSRRFLDWGFGFNFEYAIRLCKDAS